MVKSIQIALVSKRIEVRIPHWRRNLRKKKTSKVVTRKTVSRKQDNWTTAELKSEKGEVLQIRF